jgi:ADP-sugar diphosphatase
MGHISTEYKKVNIKQVVLQPDDIPSGNDKEQYTILTIQPRIAAGSLAFAEIPAGMLDDGGTFSGGAARELKEETGLEVREDELIDLTALAAAQSQSMSGESLQQAMYPSPGGCDEYIPLFLCRKRIAREQLEELQGKLTGLRDDGEKITLKIVRAEDLWKEGCRDGKTLAAWALYSGLKADGKI